ncbi:hypothetical protein D3C74_330940 [compost metagenome]
MGIADYDVSAKLTRRFEDAESQRVGADHEQAFEGMDQRLNGAQVFYSAEEVRRLHQHGSRVAVNRGGELRLICYAVFVVYFYNIQAPCTRRGAQHLACFRMYRPGNDQFFAFRRSGRKHRGFREGGRAIVHTGIGDLHAGQLTDIGLEFEDCLQLSLADLRLVRRVCRIEFRAGNDMINDNGDMVVI